MTTMFNGWNRMMASSLSMRQTGLRTIETFEAARQVIAARTPIITAALASPMIGDHIELARMVPEKVDAFSRAGSATVSAWWAAQSVWLNHMQYIGKMASRGRPPTSAELVELGERVSTLSLATIEGSAKMAANVLDPIHSVAIANARRLAKRTKAARSKLV